jgi:hypothetical protein
MTWVTRLAAVRSSSPSFGPAHAVGSDQHAEVACVAQLVMAFDVQDSEEHRTKKDSPPIHERSDTA